MHEKELSICIVLHHIATFIGILEGIYCLLERKQRLWKRCVIFMLTILQSWAGFKILADIRKGRSRLADSYKNLERVKNSRRQKRRILWGMAVSSTLFKVLPVHILGHY